VTADGCNEIMIALLFLLSKNISFQEIVHNEKYLIFMVMASYYYSERNPLIIIEERTFNALDFFVTLFPIMNE
jgi:hypothetical protein